MLKLIESFTINGAMVEIFQTANIGPDFHVRYGLHSQGYSTLPEARREFKNCTYHARQSAGNGEQE